MTAIKDLVAPAVLQIRNAFMAFPVQVAPRLVGMKTPMQVQQELEPRVRALLTDLQDRLGPTPEERLNAKN